MKGRPRLPNSKRIVVPVRLSPAGVDHLDRLRAAVGMGRSTYLRELLRAEIIRQNQRAR